jgi:hypothetical protein
LNGEDYLFKLRLTKNVKRAIERAMREQDWQDASRQWRGKDGQLRLEGWSRQRRIVILRRRLERSVALAQPDDVGQLRLSFAEVDNGDEIWNTPFSSPRSAARSFLSVSFIATVPTARTSSTS